MNPDTSSMREQRDHLYRRMCAEGLLGDGASVASKVRRSVVRALLRWRPIRGAAAEELVAINRRRESAPLPAFDAERAR